MRENQISKALDNLMKFDEIHACMVANRNGVNVMPSSRSFNPEVEGIWDATTHATDKVFDVIQKMSPAGLGEIKLHLQDYEALFYIFPDKENALITIIPASANVGMIEVEMENARKEIQNIIEEQNK